MRPVVDATPIPTEAEQKRAIRNLWLTCIGAAFLIFAITGSIVLTLFLKGYDSRKVVEVSTAIFQVLMLSYGMGFFVPALITSLRTMMLGVRMSRRGLDIGQSTADVIETIDKALDDRLKRIDALISTMEQAAGGKGSLIQVFRDEMKKLRDEIGNSKANADDELNAALDKGEQAAQLGTARIYPCPLCDKPMRIRGASSTGGWILVCDEHGEQEEKRD